MADWNSALFATITDIYPPQDEQNVSKTQYEYGIAITMGGYSTVPGTARRIDSYGQFDDYEDAILNVGAQVLVIFPRGDRSMGIILGGFRRYKKPVDALSKAYYRHRYNKIETEIDFAGTWSVKSDSGPSMKVSAGQIILNSSAGDQIILDKASKTITINTKEWKVNVSGDANINVTGSATIKSGKDVNVTASGNATIKGKKVNLIGGGTGITTKASHQGVIDLITGVPVTESKKVFGDM